MKLNFWEIDGERNTCKSTPRTDIYDLNTIREFKDGGYSQRMEYMLFIQCTDILS